MTRIALALAVSVAVTGMSGCAIREGDPRVPTDAPPAGSTSPAPSPPSPSVGRPSGPPSPSPLPSGLELTPTKPPAPPSLALAETLRGVVTDGVEGSCLILTTTAGPGETERVYTLVGATEGLPRDREVTVRGQWRPDLVSFCQQGDMFLVQSYTVTSS